MLQRSSEKVWAILARGMAILTLCASTPRKKVISKQGDYSQIDDVFSSSKWSSKYYSRFWYYFLWKGGSRVILSRGEYSSQNENIFTFESVQVFGAATNTNKFCSLLRLAARSWIVANMRPASGLVAARSLAAARGLLAAHGWAGRPRSRLYRLFTHWFLTLHQVSSLHQVSAKSTHSHDAGALNGFWLKVAVRKFSTFHFSVCTTGTKRYGRKVADDTLSDIFFKI